MEVGTRVIKVIEGGGFRTGSFQEVASVKNGQIRLKGEEHLRYSADTFNEIDPAIPGFRSYLVDFDGGEEERVDWSFLDNVEDYPEADE